MTTADALAQMQHWLDTHPAPTNNPNATPVVLEDEATLRRSFGLSRSACREQRRPVAVRVDELGFDRRGTYYASRDGA